MTLDAGMVSCLQALAADDGSADADRARQAIQSLGGQGTPEAARKMLEALGEKAGAPDRETVTASIAILRGESMGDRVRASRVVAAAGFDPNRYGSPSDLEGVNEMRNRMGTGRAQGIHWIRSSLVFPQITKLQARRILAARGSESGGPVALPKRDMISGPPGVFVPRKTRGDS